MSRLDMVGNVIMKDAFSKTFNDLEAQSTQAESALGGLGAAMAALGGAAAIAGIAKGAYELTALGAQAQTVEQIFGNLTAANKIHGDELLAGLKAASRGAVAETDLMITANRALLAGGSQLASELPRLFEIARASAAATGQDIGYIFETLVKGIVKASPLLIDNAEIYIKIGDAVDDYAASLGKSTDELSQQERQLGTLNAVLEDGGKFIEQMGLDSKTAAEDVQSLAAAWDEVKVALGETLVEAGTAEAIGGLAEDLRQLTVETVLLGIAGENIKAGNWEDALFALKAFVKADIGLRTTAERVEILNDAVFRLENNLSNIAVPHGSVWTSWIRETGVAAEEVEGVETAVNRLQATSPITLDIDVRMGKGIDNELNRLARGGDISFDQYIGEMERMGGEWARIQEDMAFASRDEYQYISEQWLGMNQRRLQSTYATEEEIQKAIRDTGETYAGLEGKIKSALTSGVDVTAEDMRLTELGLYQDKALESARRLADIANQGTASPWAAMFDIPEDVLAQGESAVKAWAAALQKDVTDLARPDLINWDAFIANFQSQADREAAQALTIDIAVGKLSAAGLLSGSDEQRKKEVAKALGLEAPEMAVKTIFETEPGAAEKVVDDLTEGKGAIYLPWQLSASGKVGTDVLPDELNKLLAAGGTDGASGEKLELPFLPMIIKPDDWDTWADAQVGTDKPVMPFLPMIIKPDDMQEWIAGQMGDEMPIMQFDPVLREPEDYETWIGQHMPLDPPDFLLEPKLDVKENTLDDMSSAMIAAMTRSPDPITNAGVRMGDIFMTGIDKAIDEGADSFFERMAKRLVPEIIRFIPQLGGRTPLP